MNHWMLKTEPTAFSLDDLQRRPKRTTHWDGVRNYQARNMLRDDMKVGDEAFIYYSSCDTPGIAGIVRVTRAGYPDHTAVDKKHEHYDPASTAENPRWYMVDVQLVRRLARVITLEALRAHANGKLKGMALLRAGNRLSVMPVESAHWRFILTLE
jgi:predicted RNA-binding protein with PUA-like domain